MLFLLIRYVGNPTNLLCYVLLPACIVPFGDLPSWNDMVALDTCPCQKGLKCVPDPSGIVIVPQGLAGKTRVAKDAL